MSFYPDIKVEKKQLNDGIKVYIVTDRNTDDMFRFAVRGGVAPLGVPT